jgi:hypothetical protein
MVADQNGEQVKGPVLEERKHVRPAGKDSGPLDGSTSHVGIESRYGDEGPYYYHSSEKRSDP